MPWSINNTISSLNNKPEKLRKIFAEVANKAISEGKTEEDAIFAGLSAVSLAEKADRSANSKKEVTKSIPWHLQTVLQAKSVVEQQPEIFIEKVEQSSKEIVSVEFDNQGRLVVLFSDGSKIISKGKGIVENIQQHISINTPQQSTIAPSDIDGGSASSVFLQEQTIDCGGV